jgi:hypothetical protein
MGMTRSKIKDCDVVFEISFSPLSHSRFKYFIVIFSCQMVFIWERKKMDPLEPSWSSLRQLGQGMVGGVMVIFPKQLGINMGPSCLGKVTHALKR